MTAQETYLVVGFTTSARNLIDQLKKRDDQTIVWVGEGETPEPVSDTEIVNMKNPSLPANIEELTEEFSPNMIFLCPGAEEDLVDLIEGDTLERFLYKEDLRLDGIPTVVISDEHHS